MASLRRAHGREKAAHARRRGLRVGEMTACNTGLDHAFASKNATIQTTLAVSFGNNYGLALAITAAIVAIVVATVTALGPEARGIRFGGEHPSA